MLKGKIISLRPLKYDDSSKLLSWMIDMEIKEMIMSHPFPISEGLHDKWFDSIALDNTNKNIYFAIELNEKSELIGYMRLFEINWINRNGYIGIVIGAKNSREKGIGTEAMTLLLKYAFSSLNLHKVYAEVSYDNPLSIKLFEKMGFIIEGKMKDHYYSKGVYNEVLLYSLIANRDNV